MANKKATKIETINAIIEKYGVSGDDKAFLEHEIELIQKRNEYKSDKPSKRQKENESVKDALLALFVAGEKYTATDLANALGIDPNTNTTYSPQKVSALLRQLKEAGAVVSDSIKRRTYFGLPGTEFNPPTADAE